MAPGERKSTEPRQRWPRLAGTGGEGGPGGGLARQVLGFALPRADCTEKVPRRRKAPDFSNSDVQRATLAIHSLGLVCVFFLFFSIFFFFFFCFCPVGSYGDAAAAACPGAVGKGAPSPSPSAAPRQQHSPARTCPEVSGTRRDAGLLCGGRTDPAGGEELSRDAPSRDNAASRCCERTPRAAKLVFLGPWNKNNRMFSMSS